jgi:CRISPR-associated protein Csm1
MLDLFFAGYLNNIVREHYVYVNLCANCKQKLKDKTREIEIEITESGEKENTVVYAVNPEFENVLCDNCKSEENRITKVYVIYSGGDDLLMVGPWDAIVEVGTDIRSLFKEFACNNESLNISGGIFICEPKYPIGRAVTIADEHLDLAKTHLPAGNGEPLKNSIGLFNECVCWDDLPGHQKKGFNSLFELAKELEEMYEKGEVSKGFVYSLLRMWGRSFNKFGDDLRKIENRRIAEHEHVPLLKYQLARTFKDKDKRAVVENGIKSYMPWIRIPVSWVSLRTR